MSVTTEKATIQLSFSKEKLEAMKFYMDEKDTTVEKELQSHIKSVYEKYVPAATRRYLDRNDSETAIQAEVILEPEPTQQETAPQPAPSTRGRRRNSREENAEVAEPTQTDQAEAITESQDQTEQESGGMSLSM